MECIVFFVVQDALLQHNHKSLVDHYHLRLLKYLRMMSQMCSGHSTYHYRKPCPSGQWGCPRRTPCTSALGTAVAIPLYVPNLKVWRQTPCEWFWKPRYHRRAQTVYKDMYLVVHFLRIQIKSPHEFLHLRSLSLALPRASFGPSSCFAYSVPENTSYLESRS